MKEGFFWLAISVGIILVCVFILIKLIMAIVTIFKGRIQDYKDTVASETAAADSILYRYAKNGMIPKWAYTDALQQIKIMSKNAQLLVYGDYVDKHPLEVVDFPKEFWRQPTNDSKQVIREALSYIRGFDLDYYAKNHQLAEHDQVTFDYVLKMYFFANNACPTMESAEEVLRTGLDDMAKQLGRTDDDDELDESDKEWLAEDYILSRTEKQKPDSTATEGTNHKPDLPTGLFTQNNTK